MRMKLDFNNLIRTIDDTLANSKSKTVKENAFGIGIGLNLLCGYLRDIAQRAIDIDDAELIGLCRDLCILKDEDE